MTTLRQAAQQALAAIIELEHSSSTAVGDRMAREAKQALRQALEADIRIRTSEQQVEPVAWMDVDDSGVRCGLEFYNAGTGREVPLYTHPQPVQQTCKTCESLARTVMMDQRGLA
jgi:hypothetical protein